MNSFTHFHFNRKICLVLLLFLAFVGCQPKYNQKVNELVREGNNLLDQQADIRSEWKIEYFQVCPPNIRAEFPSNREMLSPHAENAIRLLEHIEPLMNSAINKFEQSSQISTNEQEKNYTKLIAASVKKSLEIDQLFEEEMKLVLDDNINNSKTFETKFTDLSQRIEIKVKERDELQSEAKKILADKRNFLINLKLET